MPPVELDKPSSAPIRSTGSDEDIVLRDTRVGDQTAAIACDIEGNLVFPSYVPPDVESPTSQQRAKSTSIPPTPGTPELAEGPKKTQSDPISHVADTENGGQAQIARPSIEATRKIVTDAPRRMDRLVSMTMPRRRRAGTHVSTLDQVLRDTYQQTDESSSSSSEDEAELRPTPEDQQRPAEKPEGVGSDDQYRRFKVANEHYHTKGKVKRDGRLNITINDTSNTGYLAKALGTAVKKVVPTKAKKPADEKQLQERPTPSRLSSATTATSQSAKRPRLNIVIMVIGSRGDVQPFLKIGKILQESYGHRVRLATHPAFRDFIEKDSGLEFFSVGGDPAELMAFMVKNPGMVPKLETVKAGDIGRRRAAMAEMFEGFWRACINATDNEKDTHNLKMMGNMAPFVADAIIANPPSFAHIHCAEALGIPLHLMFTFPYTPTQAFPHPLASIKKSNVDPGYTNFISYPLVEMMVWQGLGDLVNDFRVKALGLDPVSTLWAPGSTYRLHVPFTYLWSPGLVPKPEDWGDEIDVSGFVFLDLASSFKPPQDLVEFLDDGDPPIYIGFGSIVVDDPEKFTEMIFEAVRLAGVRALVSKGWGGLGQVNTPDDIFMLDNTPHDWLFPRVKACVIHGGAGTTAIALKCGKPTMIVPFFGDQHFWGSMVANAGNGPKPVPYKRLTAEKLAEGIKYCLSDQALQAGEKIAKDIELEGDGAKNAVRSFHQHLTLSGEQSMRCSILSDRVAVWEVKNTSLKLSALAADVLVEKGYLSWRWLRLIRHKEWNDFEGPGEPVTGVVGSFMGTMGDFFTGVGSVPYRIAKLSHKRAERKKRREARRKKKLEQKRRALEPKPRQALPNGTANGTANGSAGFPFPEVDGDARSRAASVGTERPRMQAQDTNVSSLLTGVTPGTGPPTANAAEEYATEVSEGIGQSGRALARAPVDLSMAVAQGFHNAPRLYGDDTVRRPPRVTGIKSGLRAAGKEFTFGIYDGFTGLVRLPVKGAKEAGVLGGLAGFGMGIGGFVLKDIAALISPFGYTLKGISKQAERSRQPIKYIRRARIVQAQREMRALSQEERKAVCREVYKGWDVMRQLGHLIMQENEQRSIIGPLRSHRQSQGKKIKRLKKGCKGKPFESVELAEKAIVSLRKGENINTVLGRSSLIKTPDRKKEDSEQDVALKDREERREIDEKAERRASGAVREDEQAGHMPASTQEMAPLEAGFSRSHGD